jgi:hypothetical protein
MVDDLSRQRDELSKFVENHRALLSGVRRLPPELLQQIFWYCLPTDRNAVMSSDEGPILLGRICKLWRDISLSTPQLWTSLHVSIPDPFFLVEHGREKLLQRERAVNAWLELSGSCPLSISFSSECGMTDHEGEEACFAASYLLRTIKNFSKRWKNMDFQVPLIIYEDCLSTLAEGDVPLLEGICYRPVVSPYATAMVNWQPAPMFLVPSLRHVTLFSVDCGFDLFGSDLFVLRLECLTHLSLVANGWDSLGVPSPIALDILRRCSNLIVCEMKQYSQNFVPESTVTLPFLRSLEISGTSVVEFFDSLLLPRLQHFKYSSDICFRSATRSLSVPFKSIITQARMPCIESLELGMETLSRNELLLECLPLLPSLKRLALIELEYLAWGLGGLPTLDDDMITLLTPSADSGECLCPGLEEITFKGCKSITDDAICPFLTARTRFESPHRAIARLKHAKFTFARQRVVDVIPDLEPLMAEGLHICLEYPPTDFPGGGPCSPRRGLLHRRASAWMT